MIWSSSFILLCAVTNDVKYQKYIPVEKPWISVTGSHQLELKAAITQSLAGRIGILNLLPLSISEMRKVGISFYECRGLYI